MSGPTFRPWVGMLERWRKKYEDRKLPVPPLPPGLETRYRRRVFRYIKKNRYKQLSYTDLYERFRRTRNPRMWAKVSIMMAVSYWAERGFVKIESRKEKIPAVQTIVFDGKVEPIRVKQWAWVTRLQYVPQKRGGRPQEQIDAIKEFGPLGAARLRLQKAARKARKAKSAI